MLIGPHRQRYQKMRREARSGGSSNGDTGISTPSKAKATPSKRKGKSSSDNDDEDLGATPSKRKKSVKKESTQKGEEYSNGFAGQTATQFKIEYQNGNGTVDLSDDGYVFQSPGMCAVVAVLTIIVSMMLKLLCRFCRLSGAILLSVFSGPMGLSGRSI
jgi:hypothetical protein